MYFITRQRQKLWYSHLLIPYKHFIPIKDLSDLVEKTKWCLKNDEQCKKIAFNGSQLLLKILTKNLFINIWIIF